MQAIAITPAGSCSLCMTELLKQHPIRLRVNPLDGHNKIILITIEIKLIHDDDGGYKRKGMKCWTRT